VLVSGRDKALHVSGIVDFENAIAGDPLMDVAKVTFDYAVRDDESKLASLLEGYGAMERHGWQGTLDLYRMYCVLELWCWMAQIGNTQLLPQLSRDLECFG